MKFSKMHGLGNDFIVVDCVREPLEEATLHDRVKRLCDRHFGIGADGLLMVLPSDEAEFKMRLINSDGTEAEHCGNGIRCVGKFLYDRGYTSGEDVVVETVGRLNALRITPRDGKADQVRVDMGEPVFARGRIPMVGPENGEAIDEPLEVAGRTLRVTAVSMGNPHAVTFVERLAGFPFEELGPALEGHPAFPRRTNAEFIEVLGPEEIRMRVWERGAGPTLACGTGACASVVAGARTGRTGRRATVHLPGGALLIEWAENNRIYMTGLAVEVFEGEA
jgi:diaminopimelate epimerase